MANTARKTAQVVTITRRKREARVPENETARQRLHRVGELRMNNAVKAIRLLRNLAKANYEFRPEDGQKITAVLTDEVIGLGQTFEKADTSPPEPVRFDP